MKKPLSLYIHIPFCKTICTYCAFATVANRINLIPEYLEALTQEIDYKAEQYHGYYLDTIYIGGGTPSLLDPNNLKIILQKISQNFPTNKIRSIEIECNPESLTLEKIQAYQELGITRISVGIQSLNDKTLWRLARAHTKGKALQALDNLNKANFKNFGCDFILGLPYQSLESFQSDLKTILDYSPTHLSTYFLSLDTPKINTFIQDSPSEDKQIDMYQWADQYLNNKGFKHYEVSNFALPGYESKHNLKYWNREEYLGIGLSAHSFINETVIENNINLQQYLKDPCTSIENYALDQDTQRMDLIMLSLRQKKGIDLQQYQKKFGKELSDELIQNSRKYQTTGELIISNQYIQPTSKGFLIIDKITRDLL